MAPPPPPRCSEESRSKGGCGRGPSYNPVGSELWSSIGPDLEAPLGRGAPLAGAHACWPRVPPPYSRHWRGGAGGAGAPPWRRGAGAEGRHRCPGLGERLPQRLTSDQPWWKTKWFIFLLGGITWLYCISISTFIGLWNRTPHSFWGTLGPRESIPDRTAEVGAGVLPSCDGTCRCSVRWGSSSQQVNVIKNLIDWNTYRLRARVFSPPAFLKTTSFFLHTIPTALIPTH